MKEKKKTTILRFDMNENNWIEIVNEWSIVRVTVEYKSKSRQSVMKCGGRPFDSLEN